MPRNEFFNILEWNKQLKCLSKISVLKCKRSLSKIFWNIYKIWKKKIPLNIHDKWIHWVCITQSLPMNRVWYINEFHENHAIDIRRKKRQIIFYTNHFKWKWNRFNAIYIIKIIDGKTLWFQEKKKKKTLKPSTENWPVNWKQWISNEFHQWNTLKSFLFPRNCIFYQCVCFCKSIKW